MNKDWWKITFQAANPDDASALLLGLGCSGSEITGPDTLDAYVQGDQQELQALLEQACTANALRLLCSTRVELRNWHAECQELWEPIRCDRLTVIPLLQRDDLPSVREDALYIIPGTGFGTGHHETTGMLLRMLEKLPADAHTIRPILDLGTGSGILAIAAALLFTGEIDAVDNDPAALENARENIALNAFETRIQLSLGTADSCTKQYGLIIANIYAEVLAAVEPRLRSLALPGAHLLLSGIEESKAPALTKTYAASGWALEESVQTNKWVALRLKKS